LQVKIPYGDGEAALDLDILSRVLAPDEQDMEERAGTVEKACAEACESGPFFDLVRDVERLLVIVNDATRPLTSAPILERIRGPLLEHPDVRFLVACGTHRRPTEDELGGIFGELLPELRDRIRIHDARAGTELAHVGVTSRGTEVMFNRLVTECDGMVTISNVKPHYFAGFTGGRKSFLPGVTGYKTTEMNHSHAVSEDARPMALEGNPVHEDMEDAVALLEDKKVFTFQTVMSRNGSVHEVFTGGLRSAFQRAVGSARERYSVPLSKKANIVITVNPPPQDIDLYQSQHAMENASLALEEGGVMILVSRCREGVGNDSFLELLDQADSREDVDRVLETGYRLGYHKTARLMGMRDRYELWAVTDLDDEVVRRAKMVPHHSVQEALDKAVEFVRDRGREPSAIVMPQGGTTVPFHLK